MSATLQISGNSTAGTAKSNLIQPTSISAGAADQQFGVLLSMLDSLLANGGQQASSPADSSNVQTPTIFSSTLPGSSGAAFVQPLVDFVSTGDTVASQRKPAKTQSCDSTEYLAAGIPFISPYQFVGSSQNSSKDGSTSQSLSVQASSAILTKIEQEISALMNNGQTPTADGSTLPTTSNSVQSQQNSNGKDAATTLQSSAVPEDKSVNADLLRLISAAMNGTQSNNDMKQLSSLFDNMENGAAGGSFAQKLIDMTAAAVARQAADTAHQNAPSIAASQQATSSLLDLNGAMASTVKAGSQNPAAQMVQDISVSIGSNDANANSAVSATPLVTPNSVTASASGSAGSQPAGRSDGLVLNQVFRADGSQPGRDKQGSSDSGENLSDLLKQGAVQAYAANSDGSKVDTSFKQAMSAAAGNSPASAMKPDPAQITQSIVKQVNLMTQEGKTVLNMKLQPEDLGTVVLKVASQDGKISAEFNVKTPDARAFLETSIPQMRQSLETNGVSLAHLSVSLSTGDSNGGRPQYQAKKQQPKYYAATTADQVEAARTFGYNTMELKV